jgi:hypothetical protein
MRKPSQEGIRKLAFSLRELNTAQAGVAQAEAAVQEAQKKLLDARAQLLTTQQAAIELMEQMDIKTPGNAGYEGRIFYVLQTMASTNEQAA